MFDAIRKWREQRVLRTSAIPDDLWHEAIGAQPFLAIYSKDEIARLREKVVLFLSAKGIFGARGHEVTPFQRTVIAAQACVLVLNLDLELYDDFENVIVYPGEFMPGHEWEDEYGVVHRDDEPLAGEAMPRGPVVLSWPDVEASADWEHEGINLVLHEFAHKIDMRDGVANVEAIAHQPGVRGQEAFDHFAQRVELGEETAIDPYASEDPAEFFAVLSEVFFADPMVLHGEYPSVYQLMRMFYRQDPVSRVELLRGARR